VRPSRNIAPAHHYVSRSVASNPSRSVATPVILSAAKNLLVLIITRKAGPSSPKLLRRTIFGWIQSFDGTFRRGSTAPTSTAT
jgi:hypothetical protein